VKATPIVGAVIFVALICACSSGGGRSVAPRLCTTDGYNVRDGYAEAISLTVERPSPFESLRETWGLAHADSSDVQLVRDERLCAKAIRTMAAKGYRNGKSVVLYRVQGIYVGRFAGEGDNTWVLDRSLQRLDVFVVPS
jgi:hypothetical protein